MRRSHITSLLLRETKRFTLVLPKFARNMCSKDQNDVIIETSNNKGVLTLNRPKALNALNMSMVQKILPVLKDWEKDKTCVIVKGAGEKAFCAGGDVKSIVEDAFKGGHLGRDFFRYEYTVNGIIGSYKIPYIALIDGITMGGGVGLSVHGKYRVATERTLFAMPETQIGLFPDVGGSFFLPRLGGKLGLYLALTGYRLKGADVLKAGIATHLCESTQIPNLEKALLDCKSEADIEGILNKFSTNPSVDFSLLQNLKQIDHCFAAPTVEEIIVRLQKDGSKWAQDTLALLKKMSPTSLKITQKQLKLGENKSLQECLEMEYRLAVNCLKHGEFLEGVRALLIDKDQAPKWKPASLEEVTDQLVDEHFAKLSDDLELKNKL